jgi:hypothetical protein
MPSRDNVGINVPSSDCDDQDELSMQRKTFCGYGRWICNWIDEKHQVYLITFMFVHMSGTEASIKARMMHDVGNFWKTLSKWIVRRNRTAPLHLLPKLIAFPDRPVFKWKKRTLAQVTINDGQHVHGILGIPATTRMREDLADHVASQAVYTDPRYTRIRHIHVTPITARLTPAIPSRNSEDAILSKGKSREVRTTNEGLCNDPSTSSGYAAFRAPNARAHSILPILKTCPAFRRNQASRPCGKHPGEIASVFGP